MSYTELDWLGDQVREDGPFTREAYSGLVDWLRDDQRAIVRVAEHDALVAHAAGREHDHDLCEMADIHWAKNARDWTRE